MHQSDRSRSAFLQTSSMLGLAAALGPRRLAAAFSGKEAGMTERSDPSEQFGDLRHRINATRWPDRELATQGPISASAFGAQVSGVAWKSKPSWYIVVKLDEAIAPDEERFFAKRMKATTTELGASHVAMLSQPKAVATVIMEAAAKAQPGTP